MYYDSQFLWYRVLAQIALVQLGFYVLILCCLVVLDLILSVNPSYVGLQMYHWNQFHLTSVVGYTAVIAFAGGALLSAFVLLFVVGRARKCLDFAATMYLIHFIIVCGVSRSFPLNGLWWLLMAVGLVVTTVLGEFVCLRAELQDIPLSHNNV